MQERSYHHGNLRTALLEEAERSVIEHGVAALSLRELARGLGVSHAAPRRHFPDRAALLDALAQRGFDTLGERLAGAVAAAGPSFEARLRAIAQTYVAYTAGRMPVVELMYASKHAAETAAAPAAARAAYAVPYAVIEEAHRGGELAEGQDPQAAARLVFAALHGLAVLLNGGMIAAVDVPATVDTAVDGLLSGLGSRTESPA
ncbi:TetR/AcrR family transcriptional regulator [Streptomyces sp. NRRL S-87]|uniref:TetR/AcrR family transcriptional regulator n=1 Tax=Streptomyces sp. NRRL S-87 TaxID=1463920 RepID=UPI000561A653|nr:TetR/AcrR family transcriptional regulator [Streptomyces sp. NRRL S-87]